MAVKAGRISLENLAMRLAPAPVLERWITTRDEPEASQRVASNRDSMRLFVTIAAPPSRAYGEAQAIQKRMWQGVKESVAQGDWILSGRPHDSARRDMERSDWEVPTADLKKGIVGYWTDVEAIRSDAETFFAIAMRFIEDVCNPLTPKTQLTRETIQTIAASLYPDQYGAKQFEAAWEAAKIDEKWKKGGRPRKIEFE